VQKNKKHGELVHHGHTGNTQHSPHNGFNSFLRALPGDRACLSPSQATMRKHCRQLDIGVEISGPHDFAVRLERVRRSRQSVHRIPRQRFVTIAKRPSQRARDARKDAGDLPDIASQIFCDRLARRANQLR
jgi:hypothetical protein